MKLKDLYVVDNRRIMLISGTWDLKRDIVSNAVFEEVLPPINPNVVLTSAFSQFIADTETSSAIQTYTINASLIYSKIIVTCPVSYEIKGIGNDWGQVLEIVGVNGVVSNYTVSVRLKSNVVGNYDGVLTHTSTAYSETIALDGVVWAAVTAIKYGSLYNWFATTDARGIANGDFDVPTDAEFTTLVNYLGGEIGAGGKLKETGLTYWNFPNDGATNEVKFNARAGGYRDNVDGIFYSIGYDGDWWSSTEYDASNAWFRSIFHNDSSVSKTNSNNELGFSVRLLRPATEADPIADGSACAPYTGNDGKVYRTVRIGTQVWTADNLAETKYANGDVIPLVESNSLWSFGGFNDWYLPSILEIEEIYQNLYLEDVGDFTIVGSYWSSSEFSNTLAWYFNFGDGDDRQNYSSKVNSNHVRPIRKFTLTETLQSYNLRDIGQSGGLIFHIVDNENGTFTYYEAAINDLIFDYEWSNIADQLIGTTNMAIGTGLANTNAIVGQAGHMGSAAQECLDYEATEIGMRCAFENNESNVLI